MLSQIPKKFYIIAEIGINHNGDINIAKKLIDCAVNAGCDAVKFQKRTINIVYDKKTLAEQRESPWGNTQEAQKNGLEFGENEYDQIDNYCKKKNIEWFASAWDIKSLIFLKKYKLKNQKIASALLTNKEFVNAVASEGIHTFISTGMSTNQDIDYAIKVFKNKNCDFTLMHTVSTYPCDEADLNLININYLKTKYNCKVGYSGHEVSPSPSVIAAVLGAEAIERHITLDRSMYGSDQSASLEPYGLKLMVDMIRKIKSCLGSKIRSDIFEKEIPIAKKLRYWEK
jgi:N-acetylneuraminate synthase